MKVLSSSEIRKVDSKTLEDRGIDSVLLMEDAASAVVGKLLEWLDDDTTICVAAGPGNNGGDGLAVARMMAEQGFSVMVWDCSLGQRSPDNEINFRRLPRFQNLRIVGADELDLSELEVDHPVVLLDALFGSGLTRPLTGKFKAIVDKINEADISVMAIDLPSGLMASTPSSGAIVEADLTIVLEIPKLCLFMPSCHRFVGDWVLVPFGLSDRSKAEAKTKYYVSHLDSIEHIFRPRRDGFSHKGNYGHGLLIGGGYGMVGAAVLAGKAALRSGLGKLTVHVPTVGRDIVHASIPEALVSEDVHDYYWSSLPEDLRSYSAIAVGCGLDKKRTSVQALETLLKGIELPLVLDADALNIIADHGLQSRIPSRAILTPHPGEFQRLFGEVDDDFRCLEVLSQQAQELKVVIVLKGRFTRIAFPNGDIFFNSTGNAGMSTAGSGDVLTGILLGLLCQSYSPEDAAILGVYLHGLAADLVLEDQSPESLVASDIVVHLGQAFKTLSE